MDSGERTRRGWGAGKRATCGWEICGIFNCLGRVLFAAAVFDFIDHCKGGGEAGWEINVCMSLQ